MRQVPERVRRAILHEQARSEVIVGWAQLAIVTTFAVLYAVSPKAFMDSAPFEPVPVALAAYGGFTLLRLVLAYRGLLPGWFLALSVVIDMALLMGLIVSFHLQYEQPPAFVLKAPTLLYVFIFIALRALRFELGYVLLAGGTAALSWLLVVGWVLAASPPGMAPITRDYVAYLTSNSILLGAEFDKVISILVVTAVLAAAIARARRLLERAVAEEAAARELSRFFAPEVAGRIAASDGAIRAGRGEAREAAVLFLDLRGFTPLSAGMSGDAVMALLTEYQGRMVPAIRRRGGSIDKFLGDGILASFGAANPSATYAVDALGALEDCLAEGERWRGRRKAAGLPAPSVNGAFATGRLVFGAVGDETRLEYTVVGDPVNLAAKLEKQCKTEGVAGLTTARDHALALAQGHRPARAIMRLDARPVEGRGEPLDLVALAGQPYL